MHRKAPHHLEKDSSAVITQFADSLQARNECLQKKNMAFGPLEVLHRTAVQ